MSITAIVEALIEAGATQQMILAAVSADEQTRLQEKSRIREVNRLKTQKSRAGKHHTVTDVTVTDVTKENPPFAPLDGFPHPSLIPPISPKKKNIPLAPLPDWIPVQDWQDFLEMRKRKERGSNLTERQQQLAIRQLEEIRAKGHDPGAVIQQSIVNGWKTFYGIKQNFNSKANYATDKQEANDRAFAESGDRILALTEAMLDDKRS